MLTCYRNRWDAARWTGVNSVYGDTKVAGAPDAPISVRTQLFSGVVRLQWLAEQWSESSGAFAFEGVASRPSADGYMVIAYDHTGAYDPVAKASLVPTPMPPDPTEHA